MSKTLSNTVYCHARCSGNDLRRSLPLGMGDAVVHCILNGNPFQWNWSVSKLSSGHHNQLGLGNEIIV